MMRPSVQDTLTILRRMHHALSLPEPQRSEEVGKDCLLEPAQARELVGLCHYVSQLSGHPEYAVHRSAIQSIFGRAMEGLYGGAVNPFKAMGPQYSYFESVLDWDFRCDRVVEIIEWIEGYYEETAE